jgi:hypothetical protein
VRAAPTFNQLTLRTEIPSVKMCVGRAPRDWQNAARRAKFAERSARRPLLVSPNRKIFAVPLHAVERRCDKKSAAKATKVAKDRGRDRTTEIRSLLAADDTTHGHN